MRRRSSSFRSGNLRFRSRGTSVVGTHCARDFVQFAQGNFRSQRILRWAQSAQARTLGPFWIRDGGDVISGGVASVDMLAKAVDVEDARVF